MVNEWTFLVATTVRTILEAFLFLCAKISMGIANYHENNNEPYHNAKTVSQNYWY